MDIQDKPKSLPLLEFFIKKTAVKTLVGENIAELIIKDQWRSLAQATKDNFDIEITGIGTLKVSGNLAKSVIKEKTRILGNVQRKADRTEAGTKKDNLLSMVEKTNREIAQYQDKVKRYENRLQRTSARNLQQASGSGLEESCS